MSFLDKIFFTPIVKYQVVEIEKGSKLPELTGDLKESLKALAHAPAFQYLLMRLRYQRALIQNSLNEGLNLTETQIRFLQAGAYWTAQIEKDFNKLIQSTPVTREALVNEESEFRKMQESLELVGA